MSKSLFPIPIRVLILPKFEAGEMTGDEPGEAQHYYEAYCLGGDSYELCASLPGQRLYVKDGVALVITGMGKVNAALTLAAVLTDSRFDLRHALILSTGCAGSSCERTVMGDVVLVTATLDFDRGHHADARELSDPQGDTWFPESYGDNAVCIPLNPTLCEKAWALVKDTKLATTERTRRCMRAFGHDREPRVLRGTAATGDNYWKGIYDHRNAVRMVEHFGCPDPYAVSEMEDHAIAMTLRRFALLDRLVVIRGSVNLDVFMEGMTPERLWSPETAESIISDESQEAADIFFTAMDNIFQVGRRIVDAALEGRL